jgi:hypothetical protein
VSRAEDKGVYQIVHLMDRHVRFQYRLNAMEAWIEFHIESTPQHIEDIRREARKFNYEQDTMFGSDPYDVEEYMGDGIMRIHLGPVDSVYDGKTDPFMPCLMGTGYGPLSGMMEVI